jgi:hypothetical protein
LCKYNKNKEIVQIYERENEFLSVLSDFSESNSNIDDIPAISLINPNVSTKSKQISLSKN